MENQHQHIKGYRELTAEEISLMNEGKELAEEVRRYTERLKVADQAPNRVTIDQRWLAIGVTDLQKGFMALIRSIARPTTF